ncbi:hypothetical protein Aduo_006287 [Ancylostoma duodenale]
MSRILAGLEDNCLAYLDDIVIFNKDFPGHLDSLRKVFHRFRLSRDLWRSLQPGRTQPQGHQGIPQTHDN